MKNRLICLALCLVMLAATVLTGCSSKSIEEVESNVNKVASEKAITLTMWLVSEKEVDADTASRITKAVNNITESKFTTRMKLYFLTDEEYRTVVTETIRRKEDSKSFFADASVKEEETTAPSVSGTVVNETETDKFGRVTIKYPDLNPNQVDLIYIDGEDMFREYAANGWLARLDEELSASSKKIKEYVSQTLLSAAQIKGVSGGSLVNGTFAIPNNNTIGKYTLMLLDKALMQDTTFSGVYEKGEIDGFFNQSIFAYLDIVRQNNPDVLPIDASYDEMVELLAHYWSIDPETYEENSSKFSLLGYRYTDPKTLSKGKTVLTFQNLFDDALFRRNYYELNRMRLDNGYFGEAADGQRAAVRFVTGDLAAYESYRSESSEYYPVIVKYPSVDVEDVYEHMFGVCSYTVDVSRSMQILTYLTTNADFRNLIQYGEEEIDYRKTTDGNVVKIERIQETYMMDIFKTGNAFIAYPDPAKNLSADVWEIGKKQNRDALVEPLLNFDFAALVKSTAAAASSDPKPGSVGYAYNWTTGYSREVLAQNPYLKAWLDSSDRAGKGVYALHTCASNNGQTLNATVYFYNNNITNADVRVTDGDGAVNVSYGGSAGDGYEITVINFSGKKNSSKLNWTYTAGGNTDAAKVTYRNARIAFDFFNTDTYNVNVTMLTKAMIAENATAIEWVKAQKGTEAVVGTYTANNSEGGKTYTYLVYAPTITNKYSVEMMPSGTDKKLDLAVNYISDASSKLSDSDAKYALFLVTVRADSDVAVNINLNGLNKTEKALATDPKLSFCGKLDVEQLKYFDSLTRKVEALVKAATDKDKLKDIVDDLGVLFKTRENQPFDNEALQTELAAELTTDEVKALAAELDLAHFYWSLLSATSTETVKHKENKTETVKVDGKDVEKTTVVDAEKNPVSGEAYYYFDSAYSIYYKEWASK